MNSCLPLCFTPSDLLCCIFRWALWIMNKKQYVWKYFVIWQLCRRVTCFFFLLQPWISSVRLYVYYQASKNSCDTIFTFLFFTKHISCVLTCHDLLPSLNPRLKKSPSNLKTCHSHVMMYNSHVEIAFIRMRNKCPIHMSHCFIFFRI